MKFFRRFYWIFLSAFCVVTDQLTKFLIVKAIPKHDLVELIPNFFSLTHERNTGAAFGMLSDHRWVFITFTFVVIAAAVAALCSGRVRNHWGIVSLSLVLGGGIGNMIDRLVLGEVVDFFAFKFWGYEFAIFNVADVFVCCGTFILAFYIFLSRDFDDKKKPEESSDGEA